MMSAPAAGDPDSQDEARKVALTWLALIDDGKYAESWEQAASLFRNRISRDRWVESVRSARTPFGKVRSRSFLGAAYETELPDAPDGKYVVARYRAAFEHRKNAVEVVTPMLEHDGIWRVSGYFIR